MTPLDAYVHDVISRHTSNSNLFVAQNVINQLTPSITTWANGHLNYVRASGSVAKGTAISGLSDIDILISVKQTAVETLKEVYEKLYNRLTTDGYRPLRQNVSLGLIINGWKVDVVPAKKQSPLANEHWMWSHKQQTRRETNIHEHVGYVTRSNRLNEIKLLKIWKKLHGLEFPSFPLEVTVIKALHGQSFTTTAANFVKVMEYIRDTLPTARIIDPTKPSNVLSDELTPQEKNTLSTAARNSLNLAWEQVLW